MKQKRFFQIYTLVWFGAILVLFYLLWQINGDVRIINYGGLVRGATQELVKEELFGNQDDELISYIDSIIDELETGEGEHNITYNSDSDFQALLAEIEVIWGQLKVEIYEYRQGADNLDIIYDLSQEHFETADKMVSRLEDDSHAETSRFIYIFCISMIIYVAVFIVINENHYKSIHKSLTRNSLTELLNRRGFEEEARRLLDNNPNKEYVIIRFDIANFKLINEAYGYGYGDDILRSIAVGISKWRTNKCICANNDADNFSVLTEYKEGVVERLEACLTDTMKEIDVSRLFSEIKFKYGAYKIRDNKGEIKTIISKVMIAQKMAKNENEKPLVWFSEKVLQQLERENYYAEHIEQAIESHEFQLYLQPQIKITSLKIVGAESLVRWQLDDGTFVLPDEFIPVLERKGLISKLDYHMLRLVCETLDERRKEEKPLFLIAVNISRVTLSRQDFFETFIEIVNGYQVPYEYIEVEVVESALNNLGTSVIQTLKDLRNLGFKLAMDDYGAGYSSMSSLAALPVEILKLDRQFLWGIESNQKMELIITSTIELAHNMGMRVICEGVECESHVKFLQTIGCDYAQGYYFAKPIPVEAFEL